MTTARKKTGGAALLAVFMVLLTSGVGSAQTKAPVKVPGKGPAQGTQKVTGKTPDRASITPKPEIAIEPPTHAVSFTLDQAFLQLKERLATPLRHQGLVSGIRLGYDRASDTSLQWVRFGVRLGDIESRLETTAEITDLALSAAWVLEVYENADVGLRVHAGGSLALASRVTLFPEIDASHAYWLTSYDARPQSVATYRLTDRSSLRSELSFPLVALVSRPAAERLYNNDKLDAGSMLGKINDGLALTSLHEYFAVDWKTGYRYQLNDAFAQEISYALQYVDFQKPQEVQMLSHALLLTLEFLP